MAGVARHEYRGASCAKKRLAVSSCENRVPRKALNREGRKNNPRLGKEEIGPALITRVGVGA